MIFRSLSATAMVGLLAAFFVGQVVASEFPPLRDSPPPEAPGTSSRMEREAPAPESTGSPSGEEAARGLSGEKAAGQSGGEGQAAAPLPPLPEPGGNGAPPAAPAPDVAEAPALVPPAVPPERPPTADVQAEMHGPHSEEGPAATTVEAGQPTPPVGETGQATAPAGETTSATAEAESAAESPDQAPAGPGQGVPAMESKAAGETSAADAAPPRSGPEAAPEQPPAEQPPAERLPAEQFEPELQAREKSAPAPSSSGVEQAAAMETPAAVETAATAETEGEGREPPAAPQVPALSKAADAAPPAGGERGSGERATVRARVSPLPPPTRSGNASGNVAAPPTPRPHAVTAPDGSAPLVVGDGRELFPTAPIIENQKAFWIRIFSQIPSNEGLLHDRELNLLVYGHIKLGERSRRSQRRYVRRHTREWEGRLRRLANSLKNGRLLDEPARELLALLPEGLTPREIRALAGRVRFQRGLADRFKKGLISSGAVLAEIRRILVEHGVPADLAYLPHVESSFNLRTYSKFGAAGIWQFTRGTGRKFLTVRYEVDERLDPILSTYAAARFLRANHERLGSWPLAITGYNHGPQGIERIVKRKGTSDLATLIKTCDCRLFKFASKNFYAEFLAAREVATHYRIFFGEVEMDPVLVYAEAELPFYLDLATAIDVLGVEEAILRRLNPSLRTPVLVGAKFIPKGYRLRIPAGTDPERFLSSVPEEERRAKQKLTEVVRVRRGDTLYDLGRRYNVPWSVIARANQITAYHRIRPGQRLVIPRGRKSGQWVARTLPKQEPKRARRVVARVEPKAASSSTAGLTDSIAAAGSRIAGVVGGTPAGSPGGRVSPIAFQRAEGAALFQDLQVQRLRDEGRAGEIVAAYGETLGHYASWAGVSTNAIRRHSKFRMGTLLRPGRGVVVPFTKVSREQFTQTRFEYHRGREEDFFSTYAVTELVQVKLRRGDSVWNLAQSNNVPMWLFYQQNPRLVNAPIRAGMKVGLPIIEELANLPERKPGEKGAAGG